MRHPFDRATKSTKKKHPLYHRWHNINSAITNPNHRNYHIYGGKGITMYEEWKSNYINFLAWCVKNGYHKDLVLTRIDKNKNFEPSNCFFAKHNSNEEH